MAHLLSAPKGHWSKWDPGQETAVHQAQAAVEAAQPRGACDPEGPTALEVSEETGVLSGAMSRCLWGTRRAGP